jgi:hypothetical protein
MNIDKKFIIGDTIFIKAYFGNYALVKDFYDLLYSSYYKGMPDFWKNPPYSYRIYNNTKGIIDNISIDNKWITVLFNNKKKFVINNKDIQKIISIII